MERPLENDQGPKGKIHTKLDLLGKMHLNRNLITNGYSPLRCRKLLDPCDENAVLEMVLDLPGKTAVRTHDNTLLEAGPHPWTSTLDPESIGFPDNSASAATM